MIRRRKPLHICRLSIRLPRLRVKKNRVLRRHLPAALTPKGLNVRTFDKTSPITSYRAHDEGHRRMPTCDLRIVALTGPHHAPLQTAISRGVRRCSCLFLELCRSLRSDLAAVRDPAGDAMFAPSGRRFVSLGVTFLGVAVT